MIQKKKGYRHATNSYEYVPNGTAATSFKDRCTVKIQIMVGNLFAFRFIATVTCK